MNPVYNTLCAVLEEAHLLTHEAAQKLATHMQNNIHQSKYDDALEMVKEISRHVDKYEVEPWKARLASLEARVKELEKPLEKKKLQSKQKLV